MRNRKRFSAEGLGLWPPGTYECPKCGYKTTVRVPVKGLWHCARPMRPVEEVKDAQDARP
ncbi:hypothetical protein YIM1627_02060 [Thermus oshimai]